MKKKIYPLLYITIIIFIIINIFVNSKIVNEAINLSINMFIANIFPSLFPMFLISSMLVDISLPQVLGNIFKPLTKVFKIKKEGTFVFFMSMFTGFPSSAKYINDLMDQKLINEEDATKLLTFTFFSNPLFIINTVGIMFLNNKKIGFLILLSHIITNIILGLLFRNYKLFQEKNTISNFKSSIKELSSNINNTNLFDVILNSIKKSLSTLIMIFGIITFFLILISIINKNLDINIFYKSIISGIFEMTTGLKMISNLNIGINIKAILSCFLISFGGLSVHAQIMNILNKKKVKYLPFLIARIIHAFLSSFILFLLF